MGKTFTKPLIIDIIKPKECSERALLIALRKSIKCTIRQAQWQLSEIDRRLDEMDAQSKKVERVKALA